MIKVHESVFKRIEVIKDAASRSRYTSAAITLASFLIIFAVVSSYLSWMHAFALNPSFSPTPTQPVDVLQRRLLEEWVASQFVSVPILGIRISVSEVSLFGPLILLVLYLWQYFNARREHVAIARLVNDLYLDCRHGRHELVYDEGSSPSYAAVVRQLRQLLHIISNQLVFITIASDKPINWGDSEVVTAKAEKLSRGESAVRTGLGLLKFLPVITILLAAGTDFMTFDFVSGWCIGAAFRPSHTCIEWGGVEFR